MAESSTITREGDAPQKQGEKSLWYMHVSGPDDVHAVPDFWSGLAWAAELNAFVAARAAKEKWAADDNWPLTQATIRRWTWSAEQHAKLLAREMSERQEHAEKRAAALAQKPADHNSALAKLAEIPPAGSEQRLLWLEAAEQHGLSLDGHDDAKGNVYEADEAAILTLMSEARKQGQRDALERAGAVAAGATAPLLDRSTLREQIRRHGGEFHGPRVEHLSMEERAFWRFLDEVIATAGALTTFRAGDVVRHGPTGETWTVAYADPVRGDLAWCGWPDGAARLSDCTLIRAATDEQHRDVLREVIKAGGTRAAAAQRLYGNPDQDAQEAARG